MLILDGYNSHTDYAVKDWCSKHHILLFTFPPHATHLLQPLDVVCFQPFKHYCKDTCRQAIEVHIVHEEFVEEREKQGVRAQMKTLQQAGVTLACRLGNEGSHE